MNYGKLMANSVCIRSSSRPCHITVFSTGSDGQANNDRARRFSRAKEGDAISDAIALAKRGRPIRLATTLSEASLASLARNERLMRRLRREERGEP